MEPLFYAVLVRLSPGYSPLIGRLHTRYSPVRRSPPMYCYIVLPLDLHVLSLSLAFILSQDQTLRCLNCFISMLRIRIYFKLLTVLIFNTCTTCWYVNLSKNFRFLFDCGCKGKDFFLTTKFFRRKIEKFFWVAVAVGILLRTSNLIPFPQVTSFIMLVRRSLSNAGAKVVDYYIRSKLFTDYFSFIFSRQTL